MEEKPDAGAAVRPDTGGAILDAARDLFLSSGYDGVNLEQVGKAAGVSRQTVYNQFGSKDAVFRAMVARHWLVIRAELGDAIAEALQGEEDPEKLLRRFAGMLFAYAEDARQIAFIKLVVAEARRAPWIGEEFHLAGKRPVIDAFAEALAAMTARGLLRCDRPDVAGRQFLGMLTEFVLWHQVVSAGDAEMPSPPTDVVADEAVATFMARYGMRPAG